MLDTSGLTAGRFYRICVDHDGTGNWTLGGDRGSGWAQTVRRLGWAVDHLHIFQLCNHFCQFISKTSQVWQTFFFEDHRSKYCGTVGIKRGQCSALICRRSLADLPVDP